MKSVIWMSKDMREQIVADDGEYILIKVGTTHGIQLGQTVVEAKDKLNLLGRSDIIMQLY